MSEGKRPSDKKTTAIYFPDRSDRAAIKRAAKLVRKNVSEFVREAAVKAAFQTLAQCPSCGAKRGKREVAKHAA